MSGVVKTVFFTPDVRSYASRYHRSASNPARRCARTKTVRPSAENCGWRSEPGFAVIFFASPPPAATIHTS